MDYVKNAQSCVNRVHTIRGTYGGTYDTQSCFSPGLLDPKSLILIWDTGASYGLTPFRSDFIDYVKCEIPVRDVTKVNTVVGIGTTLHNLQTTKEAQDIYLVSCITYLRQMFVCSLLKRTTRCMVDTQKSIVIAYA
jgi:hypothetical protein